MALALRQRAAPSINQWQRPAWATAPRVCPREHGGSLHERTPRLVWKATYPRVRLRGLAAAFLSGMKALLHVPSDNNSHNKDVRKKCISVIYPIAVKGLPGRDNREVSKMKNQIARHSKLVMPSSVVVSPRIPGALETQLRSQLDRTADPMAPHDRVLRVPARVTSTLTFFVVEKIAAKRQEIVNRQFLLKKIHRRIFWSSATLFSGQAGCHLLLFQA